MFGMTLLSQVNQSFLLDLAVKNRARGPETSIALAKVLSANVTVPTTAVLIPANFFRTDGGLEIGKVLNTVNEIVPVDFGSVLDLALKFWLTRYDAVHGDGMPYFTNSKCGTQDFFRLTKNIDQATLDLISDKCGDINRLMEGFAGIYKELQGNVLNNAPVGAVCL